MHPALIPEMPPHLVFDRRKGGEHIAMRVHNPARLRGCARGKDDLEWHVLVDGVADREQRLPRQPCAQAGVKEIWSGFFWLAVSLTVNSGCRGSRVRRRANSRRWVSGTTSEASEASRRASPKISRGVTSLMPRAANSGVPAASSGTAIAPR